MNPVAIPPVSARPHRRPRDPLRRRSQAQGSIARQWRSRGTRAWLSAAASAAQTPGSTRTTRCRRCRICVPHPAYGSQHPLGDDAKRHGRQAQHCGHCAQAPSPLSSKPQAGPDDKARREVGPHAAKRRVRPAHEVEGRRREHAGPHHAHKRTMKPHAPGTCGHMIHRPDSLRASGFAIGRSDRPDGSDRLECDLMPRAWP